MTSNNKTIQCQIYSRDELLYKHLYQIPPKKGRYIVLDTETTGLNLEDHIVELGACEIVNGNLTGDQFHIYIRPRLKMEQRVIDIHGITNKFYDDYYKDVYQDDKQNLLNFSKWVGNSIIFAHNAPFDMNTINKELYYWGLHEISIKKYRCSMRIFREIISKNEPCYDEKYTSLEKCCEYFGLKSNDKVFHNALFDSYMTARLVCKIYEKIESDPDLFKDYNYNQESMDSHYNMYKKHHDENYNNNYYNHKINHKNNGINNNTNNIIIQDKNVEPATNINNGFKEKNEKLKKKNKKENKGLKENKIVKDNNQNKEDNNKDEILLDEEIMDELVKE